MPKPRPQPLAARKLRLAAARRRHGTLGGFALSGWIFVIVLGAAAQAYSPGDGGPVVGLIVVGLALIWLIVIVAWLAAGVSLRRQQVDANQKQQVELALTGLRPVPWVRLSAVGVITVLVPLMVQDLVAAAAAALHLGRRASFVAQRYSSGGRGTVLAHGRFVGAAGRHQVSLMDATPRLGQPLTVRVPPLGGSSVYYGGPFAWVAALALLGVLVGFGFLIRSTTRALRTAHVHLPTTVSAQRIAASHPAGVRLPPVRPAGGSDVVFSVRPHPQTRRSSSRAYYRNVSISVQGRQLVLLDRKNRAHAFELAHSRSERTGVAALAFVTSAYTDKTGTRELSQLFLLNAYNAVLAVLDTDGWDDDELRAFAARAGISTITKRLASLAERDATYPNQLSTVIITSTGGLEVALWLAGSLLVAAVLWFGLISLLDR